MSDQKITIDDVRSIRHAAAELLYTGTRLFGTRERQDFARGMETEDLIAAGRAGSIGGTQKIRDYAIAAADLADKLEAHLTVQP